MGNRTGHCNQRFRVGAAEPAKLPENVRQRGDNQQTESYANKKRAVSNSHEWPSDTSLPQEESSSYQIQWRPQAVRYPTSLKISPCSPREHGNDKKPENVWESGSQIHIITPRPIGL